ncbi:hypothetical protein [Paraburkholderia sp. PGU19]|uniref:hypothetical protein n=1 Tax=Paraburkholderia sp. PGU19 TaxID=2735434 RepID=UPI0015DAD615|nr:hypothetical protein [Paraburkholderia sp. PGU19]
MDVITVITRQLSRIEGISASRRTIMMMGWLVVPRLRRDRYLLVPRVLVNWAKRSYSQEKAYLNSAGWLHVVQKYRTMMRAVRHARHDHLVAACSGKPKN